MIVCETQKIGKTLKDLINRKKELKMSFKVSGCVYEAGSRTGIPGLVVKAFDKDLVKDDNLGETLTDNQGNFSIVYDKKDFGERLEGNPDLYIVVKTADRNHVLYTSKHNICREAKKSEYFDIPIAKTKLEQTSSLKESQQPLLKVMIGIAWSDGVLEPGEHEYIRQVASQKNLTNDLDIDSLLNQPVPPEQCYEWLQDYLGKNPTDEKYQELYENITTLISSDTPQG